MPVDFSLLSMTELRTRPGEILDRVADDGECFIIERGGKQRACLVPMSVFLPDVPPARIARELSELLEHGEKPRAEFTVSREIAFRISVPLSNQTVVELEIILPHGYPNNCPKVYAKSIEDTAPHRWQDGALCLYGVLGAWNPGKHTVYSTLRLAREWVDHYGVWKTTGTWPHRKGGTK